MEDSSERILKVIKSKSLAAGVVDINASEDESYIKGGILSNPKVAWVSCGPRLTNINCNDGSKRTGWTFGWSLGDPLYKVVCVEELPINSVGSPILVVACESELNGSTLSFYHSGSSRVLKAVHFTDKITSLAVVSKSNDVEENISGLLRAWSGVIAVGTNNGKLYLLDAWWRGLEKCIVDYHQRLYDEQKQSKILQVSLRELVDGFDCRSSSVRHGSSTLALWLNEEMLQRSRMAQCVLGRMPREFLAISALAYYPQLATLAVGYNTSCFQLWDVSTLTLLYTSALLEAMLPVFAFSLLEPSDDPRYVCYLWTLHHSVDEDNLPFAGMYIVSYENKLLNQFNIPFYEGFSSCSIRYQMDLGAELDNTLSGRIISCQSIRRESSKSSSGHETEEGVIEDSTASLLAIAWEVWTPNQHTVYKQLTLFDLNQWYREYMPTTTDVDYSHFMTHFSLPDGPLLDVKLLPHSVRQFMSLQPVDEHFYPPATSFDCWCLEQAQVSLCRHEGLQEQCLRALVEGGPSALLQPAHLFKICSQVGVKPLLVETGSPTSIRSKEQREYLLSVALEHDLTQYLRSCAADWSDGSHAVAGCTLPSLLQWAWARVDAYKKWLDRLCVPLFDYSGTAMDSNDLDIFHHMICRLHSIHDLYKLVLDKYHQCILQGNYTQQLMAIGLVTGFYNCVLWSVRHKVLPETNAGDDKVNGAIPYPIEKIVNATISRRAELHHLAKSLRYPVPAGGLLLIDALISQEPEGSKLTEQWEREGGAVTLGRYPPPSVQSLLRSYLVRDISAHVKHSIVSYFLHDIVHVLSSHSLSEITKQKLLSFPSDFGLTESQSKIVEAFWCLDHKMFEEGVTLLTDQSINREDLQMYNHRTIICLLVASGEHRLALRYHNIRRPPLIENDDIRMKMTLLLVNGLIHEAFQFQRHHSSLSDDLLHQFFTGCVEMKKLDIVFKLPLTKEEEEAFMGFLDKTSHPQGDDLRVLYLLSRSRYLEAIDMNEKLRSVSSCNTQRAHRPHNLFGPRDQSGAPARAVLSTRDLLINSVAKTLPSVTRELALHCAKEKQFSWKQVKRPTPLSVVVHTDLSSERLPFFKATDSQLMQAALTKTRETWAPLLMTPAALKHKLSSSVEDTPFLRTPILSRFNSSTINLSMSEIRNGVRWRDEDVEHMGGLKRARLEFTPLGKDEPTKTDKTINKSVDMEFTCPESNALLHTPLVSKVIKQRSKETLTPHSILKPTSAANTPGTPARSEKSFLSAVSSRQIRFSLPGQVSSQSVNEEEESESDLSGSPTLSPRKSIHELSNIQGRKATPANPRLPRQSLKSVATQLKFDDDIEDVISAEVCVRPELSATAATLLKNISASPLPSEETYFSFKSSSPSTRSRESRESFKLPWGLEGNIKNETGKSEQALLSSQQLEVSAVTSTISREDESVVSDLELSLSKKAIPKRTRFTTLEMELSDSSLIENQSANKEDQILETSTNNVELSDSPLIENESANKEDQILETSTNNLIVLKSPEEIKIVVEGLQRTNYPRKSGLVDYDITTESFGDVETSVEENQSLAEEAESFQESRTPIYTWSEDRGGGHSELEIQTRDTRGMHKISKVTLSAEIPMLYLETKDVTKSVVQENEPKSVVQEKEPKSVVQEKEPKTDPCLQISPTMVLSLETPPILPNVQENLQTSLSLPDESSVLSGPGEIPVPQILEEILKKGTKISLSVTPENQRKKIVGISSNSPNVSIGGEARTLCVEDIKTFSLASAKTLSESSTFSVPELNTNSDANTSNILRETQQSTNTLEVTQKTKDEFTADEKSDNSIDVHKTSICVEKQTTEVSLQESVTVEDKDKCISRQKETFDQQTNVESIVQNVELIESSEKISAENLLLENTEFITQAPVISEVFTINNSLEDEQKDGLTFVVESANTIFDTKEVEFNKTADFELRMSEEDSIVELASKKNENEEADPVFETLKTVQFERDEEALEKDLDEEFNEDDQEEDEDIYGGIDEEIDVGSSEIGTEKQTSGDGGHSDVIFLGSSSDEETLDKNPKQSTTLVKHTPRALKRQNVPDETLDYEDYQDYKDYENLEDEETENDDSYSDSSEDEIGKYTSGSEEDDSSHGNISFTYSSDSETESHGNRSWKRESNIKGGNESLKKEEFGLEDEDKKEEFGLEYEDDESVESPPFELIGQDSQSDTERKEDGEKLDTIVEEEESSIPNAEIVISESLPTNEIIREANDLTDLVKLAEIKRKKCLETGSILDLKKRRSKRCSSVSDLSEGKKGKLRRRSMSMHDFTSDIIKEQCRLQRQSLVIAKSGATDPHSEGSFKIVDDFKNRPSLSSKLESNESHRVSMIVDCSQNILEPQSNADVQTATSDQHSEFFRKLGRSTSSFSSSLHNISEENSPSSFSSTKGATQKRSLRRSISNNELSTVGYFEDKTSKRSTSKSELNSDLHQETEKDKLTMEVDEHVKEDNSTKTDLENLLHNSETEEKQIVEKSLLLIHTDPLEEKSNVVFSNLQQNINLTDNSDSTLHDVLTVKTRRKTRARSEPPVQENTQLPRLSSRRKSSSLLKIEEIHRRVLPRKRSSHKIVLLPLEVLHSDDSLVEASSSQIKGQEIQEELSSNLHQNEEKVCRNESDDGLHQVDESSSEISINEVRTPKVDNSASEININEGKSHQSDKSDTEINISEAESLNDCSQTLVSRNIRGVSEPPYLQNEQIPKRSIRKSASYYKIKKIHDLVIPRRRSTMQKHNFPQLEVIDSEEDSSLIKKDCEHLNDINRVPEQEESKNMTSDEEIDVEKAIESNIVIKKRIKKIRKENVDIREKESVKGETSTTTTKNDKNIVPKLRGRKKKLEPEIDQIQRTEEGMINKVNSSTTPSNIEVKKKKGRQKKKDTDKDQALEDQTLANTNVEVLSIPTKKLTDATEKLKVVAKEYPQPPKKRGKMSKKTTQITDPSDNLMKDYSKGVTEEINPTTEKANVEKEGRKLETEEVVKTDKKSVIKTKKRKAKSENILEQKETKKASSSQEIGEADLTIGEKLNKYKDSSKKRKKQTEENKGTGTPKRGGRKNKKEIEEEKEDSETGSVISSVSTSQKPDPKRKLRNKIELDLSLLDSPARRTRRSVSRLSDTELLTPVKEAAVARRTRRSSVAMSDIVLSTPAKFDDAMSEASDVSTSSRLNTPIRRSARIHSTTNTPDLIPEDFLAHRKLTRHQHAQLQKSFEFSLTESPKVARLENLPEESGENEDIPEMSVTSTPIRSSRRKIKSVKK